MTQLLQIDSELSISSRTATVTDIKKIVALVESAYRGERSRQGWTTEADFLHGQRTDTEEVTELMEKPFSVFCLLESAERLIASVQLEQHGEQAKLGMFAVSPELQGRGLGKILLMEAETFAKQSWGCSEMVMLVITIREELIAWYQRRGYRRSGEFLPFPYGQPRYGVPQRDDLMLESLVKKLV